MRLFSNLQVFLERATTMRLSKYLPILFQTKNWCFIPYILKQEYQDADLTSMLEDVTVDIINITL
jgi:hypothetical protein